MVKTLSLGGSLVAPSAIDTAFVQAFRAMALRWLSADAERKLILVVGGGAPARNYQSAARMLRSDISDDELDQIGVAATKLNAALVKAAFGDDAPEAVAENPETAPFNRGRVLVASGWKPGFSSDYDAVVLAIRFKADMVVNLSNIDYVYSSDPKLDPAAKPISSISWGDFRAMVGDEWKPGSNLPFDPIAAKLASDAALRVAVVNGAKLDNIERLLNDADFTGTVIGG